MSKNTLRWLLIGIAVLSSCAYLWPSFRFYSLPKAEQEKLRERRNPIVHKILNLGLDLQGGMHVVLELESDKLPDDKPETVREAIERAIEIIRNRIDQIGLAEPLIVRQGEKWIVVQMPGLTDRDQAISLIGRTALLEFRIVESNLPNQSDIFMKARELGLTPANLKSGEMHPDLAELLPAGTELLPGREGAFYIVKSSAEMTGASLTSARVDLAGSNTGFPVVALEFNPEGAKRFGEVTEANIERQMAIVLDGIVQSAPVIRSRIPDGHAIIEGNFTAEDARLLKTVLQAGALPAPLRLAEERTVGPTLGEDSIRAGMTALAAGIAFVFLFMMVYYKWSGALAVMALVLNCIFLLAAMAAFGATLTLPGIAGIILSIGMSVDANILIFERTREELALGKSPRLALDQGYDKAFSAILDGNVTAIVAALFLFQFGTGPVKGFGISLILGLLMSMFTATTCTRAVFDLFFQFRPSQRLSV